MNAKSSVFSVNILITDFLKFHFTCYIFSCSDFLVSACFLFSFYLKGQKIFSGLGQAKTVAGAKYLNHHLLHARVALAGS